MRARPRAGATRWAAVLLLVLCTPTLAHASRIPQGPPPTPAPPFGSPSPFPQSLRTPEPSIERPPIRAPSGILVDLDSGQVLFAKRADEPRPVASLTKIMTALLVLESESLEQTATIGSDAAGSSGSTLGLEVGERIAVRELLYALMLQSANDAALALATHISGSVPAFVDRMNRRARGLGLTNSSFASPNGLENVGFSTARDLAVVTMRAYRLPGFAEIAATRARDIPSPRGPARHVQNRNALLWLYPGAIGVKTGHTTAARYCLVAAAERGRRRLAAVVLAHPANAFDDAATLLNYGFVGFERRVLVEEGAPLGSFEVEGTTVAASARGSLVRLVARSRPGEVTLSLRPRAGLALPLAVGEPVGRVVVRLDGRTVGSVAAVASAEVQSPSPPATPRTRPLSLLEVLVRLVALLGRELLGPFL